MQAQARNSSKDPLSAIIAGWILSLVMRFIYFSSRKNFIGKENIAPFLARAQPIIYVSWHNRIMLSLFGYLAFKPKGRTLVPLASASKDGGIAAWAMRSLGAPCERGSTSRGGVAALKRLVKITKSGKDIAFTPDGPKGPRYKVQGGVITAAKMTGVPIIPATFQAKHRKVFKKSWDHFILPSPFTKINFVYGTPLFIPRDTPNEALPQFTQLLEDEMMRICQLAEKF